MIAEVVVELEDFRTGDNQSAQRPADEQALVSGAVVNRAQIMEEESPAVPSSVQNLTTSASSDSHAFERRGLLYSSLSAGAGCRRSSASNASLRSHFSVCGLSGHLTNLLSFRHLP